MPVTSVPISFLNALRIRKSSVFAGYSLLVYDYIITSPLEVEYIWNSGPWTSIKVGFLINRYANLVGQTIIVLEETGHFSHGSAEFCKRFWGVCPFYMMLSAESIRILVLMRACAVWGCMNRITVISTILVIFYVLAALATMIYPLALRESLPFLYLEQVHVCVLLMPSYYWMAWLGTIGLDTLALVMIWWGLTHIFQESRGLFPSPLINILIRDAIVFYAASMLNSIMAIACWIAFKDDPRNFLEIALTFPLLSVVGQRVILNLRQFRSRPLTTRKISDEVDKQMADMGNRLWTDIGVETEPFNDGDQVWTESIEIDCDMEMETETETELRSRGSRATRDSENLAVEAVFEPRPSTSASVSSEPQRWRRWGPARRSVARQHVTIS